MTDYVMPLKMSNYTKREKNNFGTQETSSPNYKVKGTEEFDKRIKRLVKRYPSLAREIVGLITELETNPTKGISLGNSCCKIRLAIASKRQGKSGGARVITHTVVVDKTVFLLTVYDKSEQETISEQRIQALVDVAESE
ncbi:hypothetical protein FACS189443_4850 [Planctomycetales bacterium]|nr:hypothetical protein FACS189443_4850 [Planctomycetales bacterium]